MKKEQYPLYVVNEEKKAISCKIKTKGEFFIGVAKCCDEDTFDVQRGKDIAYNRCRLEINKYVLNQDIVVRDTIQDIIRQYDSMGLSKQCNKAWYDYLDDIKRRIKVRKAIIYHTEQKIKELL
jgi:hypothetical protein